VARAIGWVFVALIAYHAVLAATQAVDAGDDGNWSYAVELAAIALVATMIVIAAVVTALRALSRTRRRPTP
jgi:Na+/serine symporter